MRKKTQIRLKDRVQEWYPIDMLAEKLGYKSRQSIYNLMTKMNNEQARRIQEKAIERQEVFGDSVVEMCHK